MHRIAAAALLAILAVAARGDEEPAIAVQISSKSPDIREKAAKRLGVRGDRAAVKALIPLLRDRDWGVRLAATRSLAPIGSTPGREALVKQLYTGATSVIRLEAKLLRKHGDAALLAEVVKSMGRIKQAKRVRVIDALGVLGPLSTAVAVQALGNQMRVADPQYRIAAARTRFLKSPRAPYSRPMRLSSFLRTSGSSAATFANAASPSANNASSFALALSATSGVSLNFFLFAPPLTTFCSSRAAELMRFLARCACALA